MKKKFLTVLFSGLILATSLYAEAETKEEAKKEAKKEHSYEKISFEDLKKAVEEKKVFLVDCNGEKTYKEGHIPGAVDGTAEGFAEQAPAEKDALVVAYCGSEKCTAWKKGADVLLKKGYTNIKHYHAGLKGWKESGGKLESAE